MEFSYLTRSTPYKTKNIGKIFWLRTIIIKNIYVFFLNMKVPIVLTISYPLILLVFQWMAYDTTFPVSCSQTIPKDCSF